MKNFYAFAHIPKTAGTSFYQILERNFGRSFVHVSSLGITESPLSSEAIKRFVIDNECVKAFGGHRVRFNLPWNKIDKLNLYAISYVRNPIDRLRSEYHYLKTLRLKVKGVYAASSYEEFIYKLIRNEDELVKFASYQFRYLVSGTNISSIDELIENDNILIFPTECFLISCAILEYRFPKEFKDCSYVIRNEGPKVKKEKYFKLESQLELVLKQIKNNDFELWNAVLTKSDKFHKEFWDELEKIRNRICRKNLLRKYSLTPLQSFLERVNNYTQRLRL
ncbi:sulfotransferase family 2 domain-containing protein [Mangrovimonas xylaniphaga]|uniref:sulfotransferase family 2 domain-containing protein n=1 Tax=Mangrovimonas xylaniphaga TaxID=1645915 RepID=UPI0006B5E77A|nr:sulfotransferase family 2 domain-containing protein [Mangrovimonas xylaniphaga]